MLLIHKAGGGVRQGEKTVVLGIHVVAVAGKRVHEQLKLVVGTLGDMDAHAPEHVFKMVHGLLHICITWTAYNEVEVCIYKLLALACHHFLHLLDVLHGNLVARIGDGGVTVFLLFKSGKFPLLVGNENHLVVDDGLGFRDTVDGGHEVKGHPCVVHLHIGERTDKGRKPGTVHIDKGEHATFAVTHADALVIYLEIIHGDDRTIEVQREIPVNIAVTFVGRQEPHLHAAVTQLVLHLAYLHKEVLPFLQIEGIQLPFLRFLRNDKACARIGIRTALKI